MAFDYNLICQLLTIFLSVAMGYEITMYFLLQRRIHNKQNNQVQQAPPPPPQQPPPMRSTVTLINRTPLCELHKPNKQTTALGVDLVTYSKRYMDKYEKLETYVDQEKVEQNMNNAKQALLRELKLEDEEIAKRITAIQPFREPLEGDYTTHKLDETALDIANYQLGHFIDTMPMWKELNAKYNTSKIDVAHLYGVINEFEHALFSKAEEHVNALLNVDADEASADINDYIEDDTVAEPEPEPELSYDEIYKLRINDFMETNIHFAYIKLFFYNLHTKDVERRRHSIELGECDEKIREHALKLYYAEQHAKLVNSKLLEMTPLGNVLMWYSHDKAGFIYHSDKQIPYAVLDTVARRYVILYRCKELYVDMKAATVKMLASETIAEKKRAVFASNERQTQNERQQKQQQQQPTQIRSWGKSSSLRPEAPQLQSFKTDVNHFINTGKFDTLRLLPVVDKKMFNSKLKMSYAEYKRMHRPEYEKSPELTKFVNSRSET